MSSQCRLLLNCQKDPIFYRTFDYVSFNHIVIVELYFFYKQDIIEIVKNNLCITHHLIKTMFSSKIKVRTSLPPFSLNKLPDVLASPSREGVAN